MAFDMMDGLRSAQAVFALIALALNGTVIAWFNTHDIPANIFPNSIAFLVFCSTFTLLVSLPYTVFAPKYFLFLANGYASLGIEATTMLFWFCGFIADAVYLGQLDVCRGTVCNCARAGVTIAAFTWLLFAITLYFPIKYCFFEKSGSTHMRPGDKHRMRASKGHIRMHDNWTGQYGFQKHDDSNFNFV